MKVNFTEDGEGKLTNLNLVRVQFFLLWLQEANQFMWWTSSNVVYIHPRYSYIFYISRSLELHTLRLVSPSRLAVVMWQVPSARSDDSNTRSAGNVSSLATRTMSPTCGTNRGKKTQICGQAVKKNEKQRGKTDYKRTYGKALWSVWIFWRPSSNKQLEYLPFKTIARANRIKTLPCIWKNDLFSSRVGQPLAAQQMC